MTELSKYTHNWREQRKNYEFLKEPQYQFGEAEMYVRTNPNQRDGNYAIHSWIVRIKSRQRIIEKIIKWVHSYSVVNYRDWIEQNRKDGRLEAAIRRITEVRDYREVQEGKKEFNFKDFKLVTENAKDYYAGLLIGLNPNTERNIDGVLYSPGSRWIVLKKIDQRKDEKYEGRGLSTIAYPVTLTESTDILVELQFLPLPNMLYQKYFAPYSDSIYGMRRHNKEERLSDHKIFGREHTRMTLNLKNALSFLPK